MTRHPFYVWVSQKTTINVDPKNNFTFSYRSSLKKIRTLFFNEAKLELLKRFIAIRTNTNELSVSYGKAFHPYCNYHHQSREDVIFTTDYIIQI